MKWFNDLKFNTKLLFVFLIVIVLTSLLGISGYIATTKVAGYQSTMYLDRLIPIRDLGQVQEALLTLRGDFVASLGTNDFSKRQKYIESIKTNSARVDELIAKYSKTYLVNEEKELLSKFLFEWNSYKKYHDTITNYILNMQDEQAKNIIYVESISNMIEARNKLEELIEVNVKVANNLQEATKSEVHNVITFFITFVSLSVIVAIALGLFISKTFAKKISAAVYMIKELGKGHLGNRLPVDSNDEIGVMAQMMNQFADDLQNLVIGTLIRISNGDTSVSVNPKDDKDEIAPALSKLAFTTKELINEAGKLSKAAVEGNLSLRADDSQFEGGFREIISGFNATLDALTIPVKEGMHVLSVLSTGDLTVRMDKSYNGDYLKFKDSINQVAESMNFAIGDVADAVQATASAANQISSSSEEMAAGSHEQSQQTNEIAGAVEEMTKAIIESSQFSARAYENSKTVNQSAVLGTQKIEATKKGIHRIVTSSQKTASIISSLAGKTDQIGEITQVINDIADQTNLLALNAAIEAARAGEQGRGFAVVADEVRKLAERTTKATKEIADTIKSIQQEAKEADNSMEESKTSVEEGAKLTNEVDAALKEIRLNAENVSEMLNQIAATSEQQSSTAEQISKNIESISSVTQQSASGTEQIARAAEDLNRLTVNLQQLVGKFKLENSQKSRMYIRENGILIN